MKCFLWYALITSYEKMVKNVKTHKIFCKKNRLNIHYLFNESLFNVTFRQLGRIFDRLTFKPLSDAFNTLNRRPETFEPATGRRRATLGRPEFPITRVQHRRTKRGKQ